MTAALFAVTLVVSAGAALRVAARWAGGGWDRLATAAVLLAATAVAVPVACGLTGLGTSSLALALVTLAVALAAGGAAGPAAPGGFAGALPPAGRVAVAAAAGVAGAQLAISLASPDVPTDAFHLAEVVRWLYAGDPGSVQVTVHEWPAGAYPKVNELVLTWAIGIARSFSPIVLWTQLLTLLLAAGAFFALRRRGVPAIGAGIGAAGVLLVTGALIPIDAVATNLPGVAWLAVAASLVADPAPSQRRPGPALLALGLAVGTKTNMLVPGAALVAAGLWKLDRPLTRTEWAAAAAGALAAGFWPLRNLVEHGSPLWPFSSLGPADPPAGIYRGLGAPFIADPYETLALLRDNLSGVLATAAVLGALALLALLARARPDVRAGAAATFLALLAWSLSPLSGRIAIGSGHVAFLWYLLPVVATGSGVLALGLRETGTARWVAGGGIAAASLAALASRPFASTVLRSAGTVLLALAIGTLAWAALRWAPRRRIPAGLAAAACVAAVAAATLASAPQFAGTHTFDKSIGDVLHYLDAQPGFRSGTEPVVADWRPDGRLSGVRLTHPISLMRLHASCDEVRAAARAGWLVAVRAATFPPYWPSARAERCLTGVRPRFANADYAVYRL
jgi:hypothetical protein